MLAPIAGMESGHDRQSLESTVWSRSGEKGEKSGKGDAEKKEETTERAQHGQLVPFLSQHQPTWLVQLRGREQVQRAAL